MSHMPTTNSALIRVPRRLWSTRSQTSASSSNGAGSGSTDHARRRPRRSPRRVDEQAAVARPHSLIALPLARRHLLPPPAARASWCLCLPLTSDFLAGRRDCSSSSDWAAAAAALLASPPASAIRRPALRARRCDARRAPAWPEAESQRVAARASLRPATRPQWRW